MFRWFTDPYRSDPESSENLTRAALVTVALFALVVLAPVTTYMKTGVNLLGSFALISLAMIAGRTRRALVVAMLIGVPAVVLRWFAPDEGTGLVRIVYWALSFMLEVYALAIMMRHIFTTRRVGPVTLLMAVNSYMLVGLIWSGFYMLIEAHAPGAFTGLAESRIDAMIDLYYFSFVTLTTLGYGDISPATPLARSLSLAEVLCGVMFTGVLVSRLIGLYSEHRKRKS